MHLLLPYQFIKLASLKAKFRALKTDKKETETLKTTAMLLNIVFLCLFWQFVAYESAIFKITFEIKNTAFEINFEIPLSF